MRLFILISLFVSISVNLYLIDEKMYHDIELTSDFPYPNDPKKAFAYLIGYHYAVKNHEGEVSYPENCWPKPPKAFPDDFYNEGFKAGSKDVKLILDKIDRPYAEGIDFILDQLDVYVEKSNSDREIIERLDNELTKSQLKLDAIEKQKR